LADYITDKFDLSLWKCWFNGYSIESADLEGQVKKVGTMDRRSIVRLQSTPHRTHGRNHREMMDSARYYEKMMKKEVSKLEEKGFVISEI